MTQPESDEYPDDWPSQLQFPGSVWQNPPQLQQLLGTERLVYLSTSSAGESEGAIRNLVQRKLLCCMCGAFRQMADVAKRCDLVAEGLQVDWDPRSCLRQLMPSWYVRRA